MASNCLSNFDNFCFMCSYATPSRCRIEIGSEIKQLYEECYGQPMVTTYASPTIVCRKCVQMMLKHVTIGQGLTLIKPTCWREPRTHPGECFACNTRIHYKQNGRRSISYAYGYACSPPVFKAKPQNSPPNALPSALSDGLSSILSGSLSNGPRNSLPSGLQNGFPTLKRIRLIDL